MCIYSENVNETRDLIGQPHEPPVIGVIGVTTITVACVIIVFFSIFAVSLAVLLHRKRQKIRHVIHVLELSDKPEVVYDEIGKTEEKRRLNLGCFCVPFNRNVRPNPSNVQQEGAKNVDSIYETIDVTDNGSRSYRLKCMDASTPKCASTDNLNICVGNGPKTRYPLCENHLRLCRSMSLTPTAVPSELEIGHQPVNHGSDCEVLRQNAHGELRRSIRSDVLHDRILPPPPDASSFSILNQSEVSQIPDRVTQIAHFREERDPQESVRYFSLESDELPRENSNTCPYSLASGLVLDTNQSMKHYKNDYFVLENEFVSVPRKSLKTCELQDDPLMKGGYSHLNYKTSVANNEEKRIHRMISVDQIDILSKGGGGGGVTVVLLPQEPNSRLDPNVNPVSIYDKIYFRPVTKLRPRVNSAPE